MVVTYGEQFELPDLGVQKPDTVHEYTFLYWVKKGTTEQVTSGTYQIQGDLELQAVWKLTLDL